MGLRRPAIVGILLIMATSVSPQPARADGPNDALARQFIDQHERTVRPLDLAASLAWWDANVTGKESAFQRKEESQNLLDAALADGVKFQRLKRIKEGGVTDPILAREIDVLYLTYLEKQVDPALLRRITAKANAVEKAFNAYRAKVGGREMTDSEVRKVLKTSKDSAERRAVWEASKGVGPVVEADLKALVLLRNEAAKALGFPNYHAMQLSLNEQSQAEVIKLFDELDELTRGPFAVAKKDIDERLAAYFSIPVDELRPWHYHDPFFQETPAVFKTDLDAAYAKLDILKLSRDFYAGIGLPIDDVLARSDLYEKSGKSPHAFCTDIDREGDVRVLANIVPNEYWMGTMLHELGHSVYSSKNIPQTLPYVLRTEAHILTTEGVAMMFEKFSKDADWLQAMGITLADPKAFDEAGSLMRRNRLLIFSRWCQVMLRFEKGLYEDPSQDLNKLWWDLVAKYQMIKAPAGRDLPDYASKIHIVSAPAYYHNYQMGELFAAQVHHTICREVLGGVAPSKANYVGNKAVGAFMKARVFNPGRTLPWNALTRQATGEDLNPRAFAADFRGE
ncbi:MAG: M2 family metallopeptidase [Isosphaeraceae bacterium]|nr:M2 family metallopeptidase [Isosphaeraceae bacterium]